MRLPFAIAVGGALAAFAACSSFDDADPTTTTPDGGANDAPSPIDASGSDGSTTTDAGPPDAAPEAGPEGMVLVATAATKFWIDAREVTTGDFLAFKQKVVQTMGGDAGFPAICATKTALGPEPDCNGKHPSTAVACVDWCDAFAYCQSAGKRLCGRIGGGTPLNATEARDWISSEWMRACSGATGANMWPYGTQPDAEACNTEERVGNEVYDAGSLPGCVGSEPGLFDMSGNVAEWLDTCGGASEGTDSCYVQGGSYSEAVYAAQCDDQINVNRSTWSKSIGFRCCKDF